MGRLARVGDVAPLSRAGPLRGASHRFVTGRLAQFRSEGHLARLRCRGTSRVRCGVPRTGSLWGQLRSAPSRASPHGPSASTGRRSHRSGDPVRFHRQAARFLGPTRPRPQTARPHPQATARTARASPSASSRHSVRRRAVHASGAAVQDHRIDGKTPRQVTGCPAVRLSCAGYAGRAVRTLGGPRFSSEFAAQVSPTSPLARPCHPHVHQTHQLPRPSGLPAPLGAFSLGGNKLFRSSAARRRAPSGRVASPRRTSRTDAHA